MRTNGFFIISLLTILLSGCKVDFPLDGLDADPIIYLDALAYCENGQNVSTPGANLHIYVYGIPPTGDRSSLEGSTCDITTYHNDAMVDIYKDVTLEPFSGLNASYLEGTKTGDKIRVVAEGEGFTTISAETVIPPVPIKPLISYKKINDNLINLQVTVNDNPESDDSYALTFYQLQGGKPSFNITGESAELAFGSPTDMGGTGSGPFDVAWKDFGSQVYYGFSDASFNGKSKTFDLNLKLHHRDGLDSYFRVSLLCITKDKLKYEIAKYDKSSNILGSFGLAPITYAYTNVRGGAGYLGAQTENKTEWFKAE